MRAVNEALAENLRKTGAEVGVYDDGLVIRGLETIVNGSDFDGGDVPQNGLALAVLSIALENDEPVGHSEIVEANYPGVLQKLKELVAAASAKPEATT
jgi:5-enolpyruvylshikimate-3-phosphate synthase